ncbi:FecCD family ABC transporter permease [Kushneria phosphatilytica]|uniref:Iron ABC transporter permease n=1 Tax=Kushneria phosphatilytica TaxID=657387 RepID=A0A1S1NR71_9GAMM|nr:iron ABC transporter permease [Kushneria phosphatilytica]OHV07554.1 iron ABC transporter permease [Kushneria phosphatilytica]QEL10041.1 iron ABC transporter permease [Kushneria phosphatilytica]
MTDHIRQGDPIHPEAATSGTTIDALLAEHRRTVIRRFVILLGLTLLCLLALVVDLSTGPSTLSIGQIVTGMLSPDSLTPPQATILWQVRLPYALMALLVGAALSLAGVEMQTILNNPLASPFTLGVSSAASFGAALAIVLGISLPFMPSDWAVPFNAFLCALGSVLLLQCMARLRSTGIETIVLLGIALVFVFNALVSLIQFVSSQAALQQLVFWSMGSLSRATWPNVALLAGVLLLVTPFSLQAAGHLTALRLGEDRARSFGINVTRLRFMALLRVSLLAATSVAFAGTIGFVGLVGPHIARLLLGEEHRFLLPGSLLTGALLMSLASAASKLLVPGVLLPIGIVTAIVGVPAFLLLIFWRPRGTS